MNARTSLWLAIPFALTFGLVACNQQAGTTPGNEDVGSAPAAESASDTSDTSDAAASEGGTTAQKHHHGKGLTRQFFHAASSLDLSDTQKTTIENLKSQLHADAASLKAPQEALHTALVAGVRAGSIDLAKLAPLQASVKAAHEAHQAREAVALNGLWSTLQPTQRTALVAAIRAKQEQRDERWAEKHEAEAQVAGDWQSKRLAHLTKELSLDTTQQASVGALQTKLSPSAAPTFEARVATIKANREAALTAFASDTFDARTLNLGAHPGAAQGPGHAAFLAGLVPILNADQRNTLATKMSQHHS